MPHCPQINQVSPGRLGKDNSPLTFGGHTQMRNAGADDLENQEKLKIFEKSKNDDLLSQLTPQTPCFSSEKLFFHFF